MNKCKNCGKHLRAIAGGELGYIHSITKKDINTNFIDWKGCENPEPMEKIKCQI